jgi:hypothetical protein
MLGIMNKKKSDTTKKDKAYDPNITLRKTWL